MNQMIESKKYAFGDPNFDPWKKFPVFMEALKREYPTYGVVWNLKRHRWYVYVLLGPEKPYPIFPVQTSKGTFAEPPMEFLDVLKATDWTRKFNSVEKAIEAIEQADKDEEGKRRKKLDQFWEERREEFLRDCRRNPSLMTKAELDQVVLKVRYATAPWIDTDHIAGVARDMQADAKGASL